MNIIRTTIQAIAEAYAQRHQPEGIRVLAYVYWYTLLGAGALFFIAVSFFGYWEFAKVAQTENDVAPVSKASARALLKKEDIENVLKSFDERRAQHESLRSNPPQIADPSR